MSTRLLLSKSIAFSLTFLVGAAASAASGTFSASGDVDVVSGSRKSQKVALLESDITEAVPYGVIEYTPRRTRRNVLNLDELTQLSATYQVIAGGIGGGSPRFSIGLDVDHDGEQDGNVFVYIGEPPNFTSGTTGLVSTGNLLTDGELRFDASQVGGTFYMTYDEVLDLVCDAEVLSVDFVVDGGWAVAGGVQAVVVTDLRINKDKLNIRKLD
jgi:hypothetical protein